MAIKSINPATGETLKTFEELTPQHIDEKIQQAADTFRRYQKTPFAERAVLLQMSARWDSATLCRSSSEEGRDAVCVSTAG